MPIVLAVNTAMFQGLAIGVIITAFVGLGAWLVYRKRAGITEMTDTGNKRQVEIQRSSASQPDPDANDLGSVIDQCAGEFTSIEKEVLDYTLESLKKIKDKRNRTPCDKAFGYFTHCLLIPYSKQGLSSRAAQFASSTLIPEVLALEGEEGIEFHKGALFYDTALAYLDIGDEARFEYYLAMASEEDYETHGVEGKTRQRGMHSLKTGELSKQTIEDAVQFAVDVLNGSHSTSSVTYDFALGHTVTTAQFDACRKILDPFHHAELFRLLYEARIFLGGGMPAYEAVKDNPYVMLRLVKSLAHLGQWCESKLTAIQRAAGTVTGKTLSKKLTDDSSFSALVTAAGNQANFAGNNPNGAAATDAELKSLIADAAAATSDDGKHWRVLRVFYLVRNSTAHQIDDALSFHTDLAYLKQLLQVVFVGYFVTEKDTTGRAP